MIIFRVIGNVTLRNTPVSNSIKVLIGLIQLQFSDDELRVFFF